MVIGFDGSRAFLKERTGTENYSYQLLLALSKIDHKNQYIVYLRSGTEADGLQAWPGNFQFRVITWSRFWTQGGLAKQTFHDKLDILFIPAHTSPLIHKPGLKTVVTVHDLGAEYLPKMHKLKQRLYLKWVTHYQLKNATKLIAVSKATKDDLVKKIGIEPDKVEVIYEGYEKDLFKPISADLLVNSLKSLDLVPDGYFLFVGTIQPRKNLIRLITAYDSYFGPFKKAPKLILVGSKGWLSDDIYKLIKTLDLEDRVRFLGRLEDQKLPYLYSGAIGLVFPSLFEGFGLPVLEAFACYCPVVCSNSSSLPEVAGNAAVLVDPKDINSIASGMNKLLNRKQIKTTEYRDSVEFELNIKEREKWIKKGREQLKKFSWEKCARETLRVLENV